MCRCNHILLSVYELDVDFYDYYTCFGLLIAMDKSGFLYFNSLIVQFARIGLMYHDYKQNKHKLSMNSKRIWWDTLLKVIIAVASAVIGVVGANSMTL